MSNDSNGYWDGATWVYHSVITNDADGSGTISVEVVPGAGNEIEVLYGSVVNGDTVSRTITARIEDNSNNIIGTWLSDSLGATNRGHIPNTHATQLRWPGGQDFRVSGGMVLHLSVASVAASQDATFAIVARIVGKVPTVTETGNGTSPTITINTERVF